MSNPSHQATSLTPGPWGLHRDGVQANFVNLTEARIISEDGTPTEKMFPYNWL